MYEINGYENTPGVEDRSASVYDPSISDKRQKQGLSSLVQSARLAYSF
jgi:hypothetical protein